MQKVFPGIISHIHVENCDHSDPTQQLTPGKKKTNPKLRISSIMNENYITN